MRKLKYINCLILFSLFLISCGVDASERKERIGNQFGTFECSLLDDSPMSVIRFYNIRPSRVNVLNFDGKNKDVFYHFSTESGGWIKGSKSWNEFEIKLFEHRDVEDNYLFTILTENDEYDFGPVDQNCIQSLKEKYGWN